MTRKTSTFVRARFVIGNLPATHYTSRSVLSSEAPRAADSATGGMPSRSAASTYESTCTSRRQEPMPTLGASKTPEAPEGELAMNPGDRRLAADDDNAAPVTILDGLGRVVRIVPAAEFRRIHGLPERPPMDHGRRKRVDTSKGDIEQGASEAVVPR